MFSDGGLTRLVKNLDKAPFSTTCFSEEKFPQNVTETGRTSASEMSSRRIQGGISHFQRLRPAHPKQEITLR